jgi:hypothetical protein
MIESVRLQTARLQLQSRTPQYRFMRLEGHPANPTLPILTLRGKPYHQPYWAQGRAEIRKARDFLNYCLELTEDK